MTSLRLFFTLGLSALAFVACKKPVEDAKKTDESNASATPSGSHHHHHRAAKDEADDENANDNDNKPAPKNEGKASEQNTDNSGDVVPGCALPNQMVKDVTIKGTCNIKVTSYVFIKEGATLTIEAGAKIAFVADTGINVEYGKLVAKGTADSKITFTSANKSPAAADWEGIRFEDQTTAGNVLDYVVIEYAGSESNRKAALKIDDGVKPGRVAITHSKIAHCVSAVINWESKFVAFQGNELSDNTGGSMQIGAMVLGSVTDNKFGNPLYVRGRVKESTTWPTVDVPIVVTGEIEVRGETSAATLTVAKNSELRFTADGMFSIGSDQGGALLADTVKFTTANDNKNEGDWVGLRFYDKPAGTKITNCSFEYAGKENGGEAAIAWRDRGEIATAKNVTIQKCSFAHNAGGAFLGPEKKCGPFVDAAAGNKSDGAPLCTSGEK